MNTTMKWFKLFVFKRKCSILCPIEVFFKMHSRTMERKKDKKWIQKTNFLANKKSLNHFNKIEYDKLKIKGTNLKSILSTNSTLIVVQRVFSLLNDLVFNIKLM